MAAHELHKQEKYRGFNINIYRDEDADSPREWCNLGTMYTAHRRYCPEKQFDKHFEHAEVFDQHMDFIDSFDKKYIALKVYLYDHSGQTVSTTPFSCQWDSGLFGIIAVSVEDVRNEYGWKNITKARRKQVEERLQAEVEIYDNYLTGEVYRYEIVAKDGSDDEFDSCGGFYGDTGLEHLISECKAEIDSHLNYVAIEKAKRTLENIKRYGRQLFLFPEMDPELNPTTI